MACFSRTEAEEFIADRSSSRLKHGLIALSFSSKYVQYSISYRGAVLWNAIGRSNGSRLKCTDVKSFLKNVVNCYNFTDYNFNVEFSPTNNQQQIRKFYLSLVIDLI